MRAQRYAHKDVIRQCRFSPYRKGLGLPTFTLTVWATDRCDPRGQTYLGYKLVQHETCRHTVLFAAEDYAPSPQYAIDSDSSVAGLMGFLTLRPGDTDAEYFESYTPAQLEYCEQHAEALSTEVYNLFGER